MVSWTVLFHPVFDSEFQALSEAVQDDRSHMQSCWRCSGQRWAGLESIRSRFTSREHERAAVRRRQRRLAGRFRIRYEAPAILLVAGDKSGGGESGFIVEQPTSGSTTTLKH
jgi:hypothetical protein